MRLLNYILLCVFVSMAAWGCNQQTNSKIINGSILGSSYQIVYTKPENTPQGFDINVRHTIMRLAAQLDHSLSVHDETSLISTINSNLRQDLDIPFITVFEKAQEISKETDGALDITCEPILTLWNYNVDTKGITKSQIDDVMQYVGMDKVWIENGKIKKADPAVRLNMNAVAKGYCADIMAKQLESMGLTDFIVELGAEYVCRGKNPSGTPWRISIDRSFEDVIYLTDKALAVSGSYLNFYVKNKLKFSNVFDPRTGYPAEQSLLSAIVICDECMSADAYSTAFLVMGLEKSKEFLDKRPDLRALLIFSQNDTLCTYATQNIIPKKEIQYFP